MRDTVTIQVGCYTSATDGRGAGIESFVLDPDGALLHVATIEMDSPSWLLNHPNGLVCYATNEIADGRITVLRRGRDARLTPVHSWLTGGGYPCHLLLVDRHLVCSNYLDGSVAVFELNEHGDVQHQTDLVHHIAGGPHADQTGPHVHFSALSSQGLLRVVDLGGDRVVAYRLDDQGRLTRQGELRLPEGFGPRQLVELGDGRVVVIGELASAVALAETDGLGNGHVLSVQSVAGVGNRPAHLELLPNNTLLVSHRGRNEIQAMRVDLDAFVVLGSHQVGASPRHFSMTDRELYVAAEEDDRIEVYARGPMSGDITALTASHSVRSPAFVLAS